jgi:hypothetical protein
MWDRRVARKTASGRRRAVENVEKPWGLGNLKQNQREIVN